MVLHKERKHFKEAATRDIVALADRKCNTITP
jgi:hypothetical protein